MTDGWLDRRNALQRSFTPAAPVTDLQLFAGRTTQMARLLDSVEAVGEHVVLFGERGVGKTSLAAVSGTAASARGHLVVRINAVADDDAAEVWRRVGEGVQRHVRLAAHIEELPPWPDDLVGGALPLLTTPNPSSTDVLTAVELLQVHGAFVMIIDEFDRLGDGSARAEIVDTIKALSDQALRATVVLVGVADDVDALIDEHESISRAVNQIEMPRMSREELREVIGRGLGRAEMGASPEVESFIIGVSQGLPHYTHLITLHAGMAAVARESDVVEVEDVVSALPTVSARAEQHVRNLWHEATHSTRRNHFREVLLAVCLTQTDARGFFAPGDVRPPMSAILGEEVGIPRFNSTLHQFADDRGPVLEKTDVKNRPRYRVIEPMLMPYACIASVQAGLVSLETIGRLLDDRSSQGSLL